MDKEEISSMVACATVLPLMDSPSLAVQGVGFASGALASAWLGKGRGAGSLTTSSLVMSEAARRRRSCAWAFVASSSWVVSSAVLAVARASRTGKAIRYRNAGFY